MNWKRAVSNVRPLTEQAAFLAKRTEKDSPHDAERYR